MRGVLSGVKVGCVGLNARTRQSERREFYVSAWVGPAAPMGGFHLSVVTVSRKDLAQSAAAPT